MLYITKHHFSKLPLYAVMIMLVTVSAYIYAAKQNTRPRLTFIGAEVKPTMYIGGNGKPQGAIIDTMTAIADHAGYDLKIHLSTMDDAAGTLIRGHADLTIAVQHPKLDFPDAIKSGELELGHLVLNVYFDPDTEAVEDRAGLEHTKIVAIENYSYGGLIKELENSANPPQIYEVSTADHALHVLKQKRAKYALLYLGSFKQGLPKTPYRADQFAAATLLRVPFYFHVSRHSTHNPEELMAKLTASFNHLVATGRIKPIEL